MEAVKRELENPAVRPVDRDSFRSWFAGYRREIKMSQQTRHFAGKWWRDLAPSLRAFIATESGMSTDAARAAILGEFAGLTEADQERIMLTARDLIRDLKPVTWMG